MARKHRKQARELAALGRNDDTELAHLSSDEIAILNSLQGHESINPDTGLPEYFSLGGVLKGVAKAAGALVGGYLGGPAGAAVGGGAVAALLGDSASKSLTTGLLSGLGAYGLQQSGLANDIGGGFASNTDLLGRAGTSAASSAISTASGSKGGGGGMSALLPILGLGAAAAASGSAKAPKAAKISSTVDNSAPVEYDPLDRDQIAYGGDPYSYGQFGPEQQFFDEVNPDLQPLNARRGGRVRRFRKGGRVHMRFGGSSASDSSEHGDPTGGNSGGGGSSGGGSGASGDRGTLSQQQDRRNAANAARVGNSAPGVKGTSGDRGTLSQQQDIRNRAKAQALGNTAPGVGNYNDAMNDYNNVGQGFTDDPLGYLGRLFGGLFGVGEIDPATQPEGRFKNKSTADWGIDPIAAALGAAGMAGLTPMGPAALYNAGLGAFNMQGPMVNLSGGPNPELGKPLHGVVGTNNPGYGFGDIGGALSGFNSQMENLFGEKNQATGNAPGTQNADHTNTPKAPGVVSVGGFTATGTPQNNTSTTTPPSGSTGGDNDNDDPSRFYHPLADAYTYGQFGPEWLFFTSEPGAAGTPVGTRADRNHTIEQNKNDIDFRARGGGVSGPGDGQSDDIPAMLSDGEHVIDAETVSMIGDGSNKAGHHKIEAMKRKVRSKKRKAPASKIPPRTGGLSQYLRSAA